MNQMIVSVRDKSLRRMGGVNHFVTHNRDYEIRFRFDDSWVDIRHKMAIFAYEDGEYGSEIFEGEICPVPELPKEGRIYIGVKAGEDLSTELLCIPVCKSADDVITEEYDMPDPKIYEQILDIMNNFWGGGDTVYPSPETFLVSPRTANIGDFVKVEAVGEDGEITKTTGFDLNSVLKEKIDRPETANVGEYLHVAEVDESGKPTKWSTSPIEIDVVSELTEESTDEQIPSAKAAYEAAQNAKDRDAVRFVEQTLTDAQKQQARANIGAGTSNFSGSYNDLTNKPNIPNATQIDTTLTQQGQVADAKAVGDALANKADTSAIPNVPGWAMQSSKPTYTASEVGALPNTTVIPDVSGKVDKQQGAEHAGQVLAVGEDGDVVPIPAEFGARDAVTYTEQSLTDAQKQQARANIGVDLFLADAVAVLAETGVLTPAYYDGSFYTSPQGEIYTI